jgi:hypothetical protein
MGGWDVYCAICGGPTSTPHWEQDSEDEYSYDSSVIRRPGEGEFGWLDDIRIIGDNSSHHPTVK